MISGTPTVERRQSPSTTPLGLETTVQPADSIEIVDEPPPKPQIYSAKAVWERSQSYAEALKKAAQNLLDDDDSSRNTRGNTRRNGNDRLGNLNPPLNRLSNLTEKSLSKSQKRKMRRKNIGQVLNQRKLDSLSDMANIVVKGQSWRKTTAPLTDASSSLNMNSSVSEASFSGKPFSLLPFPSQNTQTTFVTPTKDKNAGNDANLSPHFSEKVSWTQKDMPKHLLGYWYQRYRLFSKFDQGIHLDEQGWYSVTPEEVASYIAGRFTRLPNDTENPLLVVDAFCGVGGNAIQFALAGCRVVAIDINQTRLECAKNNAIVYGVEEHIQFLHGDFFDLVNNKASWLGQDEQVDAVFLSPPWGGPSYLQQDEADLSHFPVDGIKAFEASKTLTSNICLYLPRNVNLHQVTQLAGRGNRCEIQNIYLNDKVKCVCAYYGDLHGKLEEDCEEVWEELDS